ncbi:RPC53 [Candida margitis]|uniref:RPC53 n=1 Tax=Candida margitis TaxID=1775924 RepID=UPI002226A437|nr:RPC53 [Candida margitis]KAI5957417.1 RPC53 [Candida margitis]
MSNRLESLNSKKPTNSPTPKPGLKFKPKVVQRKSKEERAKVAPQVKQEPQRNVSTRGGRGGSARGRGRGGRNNYAGTHLVTSGPLSAGSVSIGNSSGSKLGLTADLVYNSNGESQTTPDFISNLKMKGSRASTPGGDSDGEDDPTKINMTEEYRFEDDATELFPFRPFRDDGIRREDVVNEEHPIEVKTETIDSIENTPAVVSLTESREATVKSEAIDDKIESIKESKAKLESKITQSDSIATDEASKLITDHEQVLDILAGSFKGLSTREKDDDQYIIFQLPQHLPKYTREQSKVKQEPGTDDQDEEGVTRSSLGTNTSTLRGEIGKINIHQSGKISIDLGNGIRLNVTKGVSTDFLQELTLLDVNQSGEEDLEMVDEEGRGILGKLVRLGAVSEKIIATPCIE